MTGIRISVVYYTEVTSSWCYWALKSNIGDQAVFSGLVKARPIAETIEAMLEDAAAYASHAAHFGQPPAP